MPNYKHIDLKSEDKKKVEELRQKNIQKLIEKKRSQKIKDAINEKTTAHKSPE